MSGKIPIIGRGQIEEHKKVAISPCLTRNDPSFAIAGMLFFHIQSEPFLVPS
jgi:hypothetical protein